MNITLLSRRPLRVAAAATVTGFLVAGWALLVGGATVTVRLPVRVGGLMRCCTGTLAEYDGPEDEGTVLPCKWCSDSMRVREGRWEWNHDYTDDPVAS